MSSEPASVAHNGSRTCPAQTPPGVIPRRGTWRQEHAAWPTSCSCERAMNAHPANPKSLGDGRRTLPSGPHFTYPLNRHRRLAALIDPLGLGGFDPHLPPLTDEFAFHLGTIPSTVTRIGPAASSAAHKGPTLCDQFC